MSLYLEIFNNYLMNEKRSVLDALLMTIKRYYTDYQSQWKPTEACPDIEKDSKKQAITALYQHLIEKINKKEVLFFSGYELRYPLNELRELFDEAAKKNGEYDYDKMFNQLIKVHHNNMVGLLLDIVSLYKKRYIALKKEAEKIAVDPAVEQELSRFLAYLKTKNNAPIGNIILPYTLPKKGLPRRIELTNKGKKTEAEKSEVKKILSEKVAEAQDIMPEEFIKLVACAKAHERALLLELTRGKGLSSALVSKCENEAAEKMFSMEVLVAQIIVLEKALQENQIQTPSEKRQIAHKVQDWIQDLYKRVGELILDSTSLEALKSSIKKKLISTCLAFQDTQFQIFDFSVEISAQIDFLEEKGFFKNYYENKELYQKYDQVHDFFTKIQKNLGYTSELGLTFKALFEAIIKKAYKPIEAQKHRLMEDDLGTVGGVFNTLVSWFEMQYKSALESDLVFELRLKLLDEKRNFETWREISQKIAIDEPRTYRKAEPLARELVPLRFTYSLDEDPREILNELKQYLAAKNQQATSSDESETSEEPDFVERSAPIPIPPRVLKFRQMTLLVESEDGDAPADDKENQPYVISDPSNADVLAPDLAGSRKKKIRKKGKCRK